MPFLLPARSFSTLAMLLMAGALPAFADIQWGHLSSAKGELPNPGGSKQQTGALVADLDKNSAADIVISYRVHAPALVWIRRTADAWERSVIDKDFIRVEAGGAAFDIDGDGDLDIVFGEDAGGNKLYWWENPYPDFDPNMPWTRRVIKSGGANQHHDQIFGDFKGTGKPQLVFWNQRAKTLFIANIPADPKNVESWPAEAVYAGQAGEQVENAAHYAEGLDAFDVDGDGRVDLLAGNYWFKYEDGKFRPIKIGTIGGRIRAGKFKPGKPAQIVIAPGDGSGPLRFYEAEGDPAQASSWQGRDLLEREMVHGHTLDVRDVDGDGNPDIFAAEMAKWTNKSGEADHPDATAWILYGDGKGNFRKTVLVSGHGWHEGQLGDFDGDGDIDVMNKPYTWNAPRLDLWLNNGTREGGSVATKQPLLPFKQHLGMELWTYRRELAKDLPGTLAMVRKMGFKDVETASLYNRSAAEFRRILDGLGMTCNSYITNYKRMKGELDAVVSDAKTLGAKYVLIASIPRTGELTEEDVRSAAADFNAWGEKLKTQELQFGYHPHGFEFVKTAGGNLFDVMLAQTRPEYVVYELDVFWFTHGGADPVKYLNKHPGRFPLMHVKDMAKGTPMSLTGKAPDEASVALGTGAMDWPAILQAAGRAGVKYYYIEDESPDAPAQVPVTLEYLKKMKF